MPVPRVPRVSLETGRTVFIHTPVLKRGMRENVWAELRKESSWQLVKATDKSDLLVRA